MSLDLTEVPEVRVRRELFGNKVNDEKKVNDEANDEVGEPSCVICLTNKRVIAPRHCNHLCSCITCSNKLKRCPMCRGSWTELKRIYY